MGLEVTMKNTSVSSFGETPRVAAAVEAEGAVAATAAGSKSTTSI
jgi:hypothetical protein